MGGEEKVSVDELNREVMSKLEKSKKGSDAMRGVSRFTRYVAIIIGLCLVATMSVSAYFIVKPHIKKQNTKENEATPAPITRWKIEGETLTISGYGPMNATNRNPMDEWLSSGDVIKKVIIEDGVSDIDGGAFKDFVALESVEIAESVTKIGGGAFKNCTALKSIVIPNSVTEIGMEAFGGCTNLENITMTKGLKYLGENAFNDTKWFKQLEKDGMTLKDGVIYSAINATGDIKIGEDITVIADGAFCGSDIKSVEISADIDRIGYRMFLDCKKLEEVKILSEVTDVVDEAFMNCESLKMIQLPDSTVRIGVWAFANCVELGKIQLPAKLEMLGDEVFVGCSRLEMVKVPEGLKEIGVGIFANCDSLTTIYGVGGSLAENLALNGDYEFVKIAEGEEVDKIFVYTGYDYISPIYHNQTWKYDSEEIGCEVYEWSEDVVIPIPKPEGGSGLQIIQGSYYLMGIDRDEWNAYVDMMSKEYVIEVSEYEGEGWSSSSVNFINLENNITASVSWSDFGTVNNMRNYCSASVFVGSDYKNTQLSNGEVLDKILEKLDYDNGDGFSIMNVSSETNYKDGFDVYLVGTSSEYAYANDYAYTYICALRGDEIVLLDSLRIFLGENSSIEFLKTGEAWKAYITENNGKSGLVGHNLIEYDMVDGVFVKGEIMDADSITRGKNTPWIVLRKNADVVDIYALEANGSLEDTPYYGWYKVGDKVAVIDSEGVMSSSGDD